MNKANLILQAATEVFAEKGFHKATTGDISRQAQIAVGTIYNYFSSKDEILIKIYVNESEKRQAFANSLAKMPNSCLEKLELLLQHHFSALNSNPALARVIISEKSVVRKLDPTAFSPDGGMVRIIADILKHGEMTNRNLEIAAILIFGMVEIIMERSLDYPEFNSDKARNELSLLLKNGLV